MNVKKEKFLSLLSEAFFPLLFAVAGGLLISESCRLTAKYNPKVWLIGPSGFMMIIGLLLILLTLVEILKTVLKNHKSKPIMGKLEDEDSESSDITAETINNYETAEDVQTEENKKQSRIRMLISFGMLVVYAFLVKPLGFAIASTLFIGVDLKILRNSWKSTIITSVVVFIALLYGAPAMGLSLPRGVFGF